MPISICPWCHEKVEADNRRLDGGAKVMEHLRHCEYAPKIKEK